MKYKKLKETENGWTNWYELTDNHRFACCECGLVHNFEHRITENGIVEFRVQRNNRATAQKRRHL